MKCIIFYFPNIIIIILSVFSACGGIRTNLKVSFNSLLSRAGLGHLGKSDHYYRSVYLKVDVGYHRAGVPSTNSDQLLEIAKLLYSNEDLIDFQGLYAHCGNSYSGKNPPEVQKVFSAKRLETKFTQPFATFTAP